MAERMKVKRLNVKGINAKELSTKGINANTINSEAINIDSFNIKTINTRELLNIMANPRLTFNQRLKNMARLAENSADLVRYSDLSGEYFENGVIKDLLDGKTPCRARYCVPDYELFLKQGSEFLELEPPADIWEAVGNLLCLYHNIPSEGGTPVYMGNPDRLLEPYVRDEAEAEKAIRFLLIHVDRTFSNAFCHMNLGPEATRTGQLILRLTKEMKRPCPNLTMLYRPDMPAGYLKLAIETAMTAIKPGFANDLLYRKEMGNYAVVSGCNALPVGGCGLTQVRLNLNRLPELSGGPEDLLNRILPRAVTAACDAIDSRSSFIVDDCHYYENNFLYKEGLIKKDRDHTVGLVGFTGLAECVNGVLGLTAAPERFGHGRLANALGQAVMERIRLELDGRQARHGRYRLYARAERLGDGTLTEEGQIPAGEEPELFFRLRNFIRLHEGCDAGCGGLFPFDETVKDNPGYLMNILNGAFFQGARYLSFYSDNTGLARVSGRLKPPEADNCGRDETGYCEAPVNGAMADKNLRFLSRIARS